MRDEVVVVVEGEGGVVVVVNGEAEVEGDLVCRKGDPSWGWMGREWGLMGMGDGGWISALHA